MLYRYLRQLFLCFLLLNSVPLFGEKFWHPTVDVDGSPTFFIASVTSMNSSNQAVVVWMDFTSKNLFSADYDYATDTWSDPVLFIGTSPDYRTLCQIIVDPSGTATVLWHEGLLNSMIMYSAQKPLGGSWGPPVIVENAGRPIRGGEMALSANGDIVAAWIRTLNVSDDELYSSTLSGGVWSPPVLVSVSGELTDIHYSLAIDDSGNSVLMWTVYGATNVPTFIRASYKPVSGAWGPPIQISANDPGFFVSESGVIFDSFGNAYGLFGQSQDNRATYSVYAVDLPFMGSWSSPQAIQTNVLAASSFELGIDSSNNITAVWLEGTPGLIVSARRLSGQFWNTPIALLPPSLYDSINLGVDLDGNALLAYIEQVSGTTYLKSLYSPVGLGWQALPQIAQASFLILTPDAGFSMSPNGNALITFMPLVSASTPVLSSLFAVATISSPTILSGAQRINRFLCQKEYYNVLKWTIPSIQAPVAYNIYRSSNLERYVLIATVPANVFEYKDRNLTKKVTYTYSIVSVGADGNFSAPAVITIPPK